jgi:dolichyl-phosphate beta-glucosyltransferase
MENLAACIRKGHDIAIASRECRKNQPIHRRMIGKAYSILVSLVVIGGIRDTICGFKMFTSYAAKEVAGLQTLDGLSFDAEILFIARKLGYTIREVPVEWVNKKGSRVKPMKDSFRVLVDLFRIRRNSLIGKYKKHA